jgi:hypothetical protein
MGAQTDNRALHHKRLIYLKLTMRDNTRVCGGSFSGAAQRSG